MYLKEAQKCRQSPLQKAASYGENALRVLGTVKSIYETGKAVYGAAQVAAPYVQAAAALL